MDKFKGQIVSIFDIAKRQDVPAAEVNDFVQDSERNGFSAYVVEFAPPVLRGGMKTCSAGIGINDSSFAEENVGKTVSCDLTSKRTQIGNENLAVNLVVEEGPG